MYVLIDIPGVHMHRLVYRVGNGRCTRKCTADATLPYLEEDIINYIIKQGEPSLVAAAVLLILILAMVLFQAVWALHFSLRQEELGCEAHDMHGSLYFKSQGSQL